MIYTWYILLFYRFLTSWPQLSVSLLPSPRQELQGAPPPTPTSSLGKCHLNGWLDLQFTLLWLWCDRSTDPLDHKRFKQVVQSTLAAEKNEELSEWGPESYIYIYAYYVYETGESNLIRHTKQWMCHPGYWWFLGKPVGDVGQVWWSPCCNQWGMDLYHRFL